MFLYCSLVAENNFVFLLFRFGLILERESDLSLSPSNPSLLVLHHPLDDLTRIVVHQKSGLPSIEWTSDRHKIIMTSKDPSICMTYDSELVRPSSNFSYVEFSDVLLIFIQKIILNV